MPEEGFRKWMGCDYEIMEDGHAVIGLNITDDMRNLRGVVQGGVIAALVDISMATAASGGNYDTRKRPMATLELKVNYTAPANGARLTATARAEYSWPSTTATSRRMIGSWVMVLPLISTLRMK